MEFYLYLIKLYSFKKLSQCYRCSCFSMFCLGW